jgi:hypothetical protein
METERRYQVRADFQEKGYESVQGASISLFERPDRDAPELAAEMAPGRLRYGPEARAAAAQAGEPLEKVDRIEDSETDCRLQINPIGIG